MRSMAGTMRIRGLLFDKDGTLFDYFAMWQPAYRQAAESLAAAAGGDGLAARLLEIGGYDPATGRLDPASVLACGTVESIIELWRGEPALSAVEDCAERVHRIFRDHATGAPRPVVDLEALFRRLRRRGLSLGVATGDTTDNARRSLDAAGVGDLLDFIAGYDAGFGEKPDPGPVYAFCAHTGLECAEVAVVGDAVADLTMARAAGVGMVVGVLSGVSPRRSLQPLADHVLDSVAEIESLLGA